MVVVPRFEDFYGAYFNTLVVQLTPYVGDKPGETVRPDSVRKVKVSLLDNGVSAIHSDRRDWFEVLRTAPSGDMSWVRILAHAPDGSRIGEIKMLIGGRNYDHYFREDPIISAIDNQATSQP